MSGGWELPERERQRNARDLERLMAELDEADRRHGLGAPPAALEHSRSSRRRARGERSRTALIALVVSVLLLGFVVVDNVDVPTTAARAQAWLAGEPAPPREGRGYAFAQTQPGSNEPVGWDPCEPIRVLINPAGAHAGGVRMVQTALDRTSSASGLQFDVAGSTTSREFFDPRRELPEPVLIGWAPPKEVDALAGRVAGLGGAASRGFVGGRQYLVEGSVVLDGPLFRTLSRSADGLREAQAIIDHEVAHLVGLSHVEDSSQLMNAESGATEYGAGDLAGLAALGAVPCGGGGVV